MNEAGETDAGRGGVTDEPLEAVPPLVLAPSAREQCCCWSLRRVMPCAGVWAGKRWSCLLAGRVSAAFGALSPWSNQGLTQLRTA